MKHHIFLSYSRKDLDLMRRIRADLQALGFTVWTDEGIDPGTPLWDAAIEDALKTTGCMVVILTPNAVNAKGLRDEIHYANIHEIRIFPVLAVGDAKTSVPYRLSGTQWTDIRADYRAELQNLCTAIRNYINGSSTIAKQYPILSLPNQQAYQSDFSSDTTDILLPPFDWCYVPAGDVNIENHSEHRSMGVFQMEGFRIAKYPVTNSQFQVFVNHPIGYSYEQWWDFSNEAMNWRKTNPKPRESTFGGSNHPRTDVCWYEAMAYCHWLSYLSGFDIAPPTEQQWQRAAQGDDNRLYPWDMTNKFDKSRCNTLESKLGLTTEVNLFADGISPFGVYDMSGNVFEWCLSDWQGSKNIKGESPRVVRGGSFKDDYLHAQTIFSGWYPPNHSSNILGFRIVRRLVPDEVPEYTIEDVLSKIHES
jgi:formylglycine-generating enzyme required for sulfatase activity